MSQKVMSSKEPMFSKKLKNTEVKEFLTFSLSQLAKEFEKYQNIYSDVENQDSENNLFKSEERSLLGLYNNAIVRKNKEYQTFQEYGTYNEGEFLGRVDMFVFKKDFDLIIEAKKWKNEKEKMSSKEVRNCIEKAKTQLRKYYKSEKKTSLSGNPYIMVLIFEYVDMRDKKPKYLSDYNIQSHDGINFYTWYKTGNDGLMVYGWVA